jgi:hypothetical protein
MPEEEGGPGRVEETLGPEGLVPGSRLAVDRSPAPSADELWPVRAPGFLRPPARVEDPSRRRKDTNISFSARLRTRSESVLVLEWK